MSFQKLIKNSADVILSNSKTLSLIICFRSNLQITRRVELPDVAAIQYTTVIRSLALNSSG